MFYLIFLVLLHFQFYFFFIFISFSVPGPLKVTPKYVERVERQDASFKCVSTAVPPFPSRDFKWTKNSKTSIVSDSRISVSPDGTLSFKGLQALDNGTYSCSITMISSSLRRLDFKDNFDLKVFRKLSCLLNLWQI